MRNADVLQTIVGAVEVADGDRILEIGPGHGELTVPLALAARDKHCEIVCIEKDHALIEGLQLLAAKEDPSVEIGIVEGDALKLLPVLMAPGSKIVGNIPYYITGKLLRVISELGHQPVCTVLLVQEEVAERICAAPPAMNRLAASVQFWAAAEIVAHVPRTDFLPVPEVDSAIIVLKKKKISSAIDPALYYEVVRAIFAQPRKTLLNNLSAIAKSGVTKESVVKIIKEIGIDPAMRPQNLDIKAIIAIANAPLWG